MAAWTTWLNNAALIFKFVQLGIDAFVITKSQHLFPAVQSTDLYSATLSLVKTGWSIATTTTARPPAASNASTSRRSTWTSPHPVRSKDYPDSDRRSGKSSRIMDDDWQRILKDLRHRHQVIPKRKSMSGDPTETRSGLSCIGTFVFGLLLPFCRIQIQSLNPLNLIMFYKTDNKIATTQFGCEITKIICSELSASWKRMWQWGLLYQQIQYRQLLW